MSTSLNCTAKRTRFRRPTIYPWYVCYIYITKIFSTICHEYLQYGSQFDYSKLPGEYFPINIIFGIFGIGMQSFAIAYERFHMDPMKRGLINQLITTFMAFLMCYSISRIIRFALEWLAPQPMPNFLFNISTLVGWLVWSGAFGMHNHSK